MQNLTKTEMIALFSATAMQVALIEVHSLLTNGLLLTVELNEEWDSMDNMDSRFVFVIRSVHTDKMVISPICVKAVTNAIHAF